MSKFNLELSKFKKVKDEPTHVTLKHSDGHEIKIAKAPLSPKMRSQLSELPHFDDGGPVSKEGWQSFQQGFNGGSALSCVSRSVSDASASAGSSLPTETGRRRRPGASVALSPPSWPA